MPHPIHTRLWIHGVNTFVQFPKRTLQAPNLGIEHMGTGTVIKQNGPSDNWFHIPIPTPTILDESAEIYLHETLLKGKINGKALIDNIQLLVNETPKFSKTVAISGLPNGFKDINETLEPPDPFEVGGGLVVSVHVSFLTGTGEVIVRGARASFIKL